MTKRMKDLTNEEESKEELRKRFEKLVDSSMFNEGKKRMKEYELTVRRKKKIANLKKRIKSRRKRKKIYEHNEINKTQSQKSR